MTPAKGVRVTITDLETLEAETKKVPPGEYFLLVTHPCRLAHTQVHKNGTHVLTIKGRTAPLKERPP